jgi:hypothetical protein
MKKVIALAITGLFLLPLTAHAAWWKATVKSVDSQDRKVLIERVNSETKDSLPPEVNVKILENAKLKNMTTLAELQPGQLVKLDVRANKEQGDWDANYIELISAKVNPAETDVQNKTNVTTTEVHTDTTEQR